MFQTRMLTIILSVFACILFSSSITSAQIRTVLVSPVPNDPVASGTALRNALAGIASPSSTNRWLLKIEPGIYQLQGNALVMRPWVDIEGSGIGVTTIRLSSPTTPTVPTISGASDAELRMLTVETMENVIAMFNSNAHPRIYRVKFVVQTNLTQAWAMQNLSSAPKIEECEFVVSINASSSIATGISFIDFIHTGAKSSIRRSQIKVSGATTNYGVYMFRGQTVTEIQETRIDVTGAAESFGIYAAGGDWVGGDVLALRNVIIKSSASSARSVGILLEQGTTVGLEISHSKIEGLGAPTAKGIFQGGYPAVYVEHSIVAGATKTVEATAGSISIQGTGLFGGPATAALWQGCMGVWDEFGVFYTHTGCPQ